MGRDVVTEKIETVQQCDAAAALLRTSDLTWLLHRASHLFGEAVEEEALRQGIGMRAHLLLTALVKEPGRTQLALGAALGLDKTTVTTALDKLEKFGFVVRRPDPNDRRVRIPEITDAGREVQGRVEPIVRDLEERLLGTLGDEQRVVLREILAKLVTSAVEGLPQIGGSCM